MSESRMYDIDNYPPTKARKATQACNQCRKRRRRCEGGQPCLSCLENSADCVFDDNDRPPEGFRRALRHAQQHANKIEALSQKLDRLACHVNAIGKHSDRVVPTPACRDLYSEHHPREEQIMATTACPIEKWPEVDAMLCKAQISSEAALMDDVNISPNSMANAGYEVSSNNITFDAASNPRKRKRGRQRDIHHVSSEFDQRFISNEHDHISRDRAQSLIQSYFQNIHKLHPIVDLAQLGPVLSRLVEQHHFCCSTRQLQPMHVRRKHLTVPPSIESMAHALLYIILALGEICEHRRLGTSFAKSTDPDVEHMEHELHTPISMMIDRTCHVLPPRHRSSEVRTPGLPFYKRATRIIGLHLDGNNLIHAQVALLAGLYKSLVGRPTESLNWIYTAGRAIENLIRRWNIVERPLTRQVNHEHRNSDGHYLHREYASKTRNLISFSAWTCIQLEHDLQSHAKLPQSGLLMYEDILPLPCHGLKAQSEGKLREEILQSERMSRTDIILTYYTAQLALRKAIDRIHEHYLGDRCLQLSSEQLCIMLRQDRKTLEDWPLSLPGVLRWSDDTSASNDVLSKKLRMKYYNGLSNVYRPYLDYALHIRQYYTTMQDVQTLAVDGDGNARSRAEIYVFQVLARMPDCEIRDAIGCCLQAAFRSVRTFLSTAHELLLLDCHGVASTQYKNVLMLCAAYTAPTTRPLIRLDDLVELITSFLAFIKEQASMNDWCSNTCVILSRILAVIFDAG